MANLLPNNEYSDAFRTCLKNREVLVDTINSVDYYLLESDDRPLISINDLFLEKRDNLGRECANLLFKQVQYQYQVLNHVPHIGDLQILLEEFSIDAGCFKHLLSNDVTNHVYDLKMSATQTNVCISFAETSTHLEPIDCLSLVNFADKFLQLIIEELLIHQKDCEQGPCGRCNLLNDEEIDVHKLTSTPLLQNFGSYLRMVEVQTGETDTTNDQDLTNPCANSNIDISFHKQATELHEEYSYERFKDIVLRKYEDLEQYYEENVFKNVEGPVVILYTDTEGVIKVANCASIAEAKLKANSLEDMSKDLFPVVLIATTDYKFRVFRKRIVRLNDSSSRVGKEETPSIPGTLETPPGREPNEFPMLFYLDTGADTGSVGYKDHIIKHFVLTVLSINGEPEPAILCSFKSANITGEEIQVFDVDEDPRWNAIGLSILKNYRIYIDIRNGKVEIGKHEDVTEYESDETFEVTFKKDIVRELQIDGISQDT